MLLRKVADYYNPLFLDNYELTQICFFSDGKVVFKTDNGWFPVAKKDSVWWQGLNILPNNALMIDIDIEYKRKLKPDLYAKYAFYIPLSKGKRKYARLYLPIDAFSWETIPKFSFNQMDYNRVYYDLKGLLDYGVGVLIQSETAPITREQAEQEEFEIEMAVLEPKLRGIIEKFVSDERYYEGRRKLLEAEKTRIEQDIKKNADERPFWINDIVKPIAELMIREPELSDREYSILGPFGMGATVAIHFYRKGFTENQRFEGDNCLSISFQPYDLRTGQIRIIDYSINTGEYRTGTIGELNEMNHPKIPLKPTVRELVELTLQR